MNRRGHAGRPSKYHAVRTTVDGITFASKKEAKRYQELKLLEKAGEIWDLELQPTFRLMVPVQSTLLTKAPMEATLIDVGCYKADFAYYDKRRRKYRTVEDVKGMKTPVYRLKKKIVEAIYGIEIREV